MHKYILGELWGLKKFTYFIEAEKMLKTIKIITLKLKNKNILKIYKICLK